MQSKNSNSVIKNQFTYSNYPPDTGNGLRANYYVSPSAMVSGDFLTPNPWGYTVRDTLHFRGVSRLQYETGPKNWVREEGAFGYNSDPPFEPAWDRSLVYNMALEKLNSRVRGDLDLTLALAEIGSTARMIKSLKRFLDFARGWGGSKDLANGWLEFQYGWRPLMSDIFGVANESVNVALGTIKHVRARVSLPIKENRRRTVGQIAGLTNVPTVVYGTGKQSCTIGVTLTVPSSAFEVSRWASFNPIGLAWELIPYSFVFDWFLNVSGYLRSLETALLYDTVFTTGYVSELFAYDGGEEVYPAPFKKQWTGYHNLLEAYGGRRTRLFVRAKLTSYPLPRKPTFKVDLNATRIASAGALLRQIL